MRFEPNTFFFLRLREVQEFDSVTKKLRMLDFNRLRHFKCFDAQMSFGSDSHLCMLCQEVVLLDLSALLA